MLTRFFYIINISFLILIFTQNIFAQKSPIKFGEISLEDLKMTRYELDSGAQAIVLCDFGITELEMGNEIMLRIDRHIRIKIIGKGGYSTANFTIPMRKFDKLYNFKAVTYNLENEQITKSEFFKKDIFTEEVFTGYFKKKIAMPQVKEGSVFEIKYSISTPYIAGLRPWIFQREHPTRYSEYRVYSPGWFYFNKRMKGFDTQYVKIPEFENKFGESKPTFHAIAEKMPAFRGEDYVTNIANYFTMVEFEIGSIQIPAGELLNFSKTWKNIWENFSESETYGNRLKKRRFCQEIVERLKNEHNDSQKLIEAIYTHLKEKITWNKSERVYASGSFKSTYELEDGNSADLNLMLVLFLREAGFDSNPIILSTRKNGLINPFYPTNFNFNTVIAGVKLENQPWQLLDLTNPKLPMSVLPAKNINGDGFMLKEKGFEWVSLNPTKRKREVKQVKLKMNEDGQFIGTLKNRYRDYGAYSFRKMYEKFEEKEDYLEYIENHCDGLKILNSKILNLEELSKEVSEVFDIELSDQIIDGGDRLYFNPMLAFGQTKNPFRMEDRKYPVDYNYPIEEIYSAQFEIPEGFAVEELPENAVLALPNNDAQFTYTSTLRENILNVTVQMKINKHVFLPVEYQGLKEFYNLIIEKNGAQIVLKKS